MKTRFTVRNKWLAGALILGIAALAAAAAQNRADRQDRQERRKAERLNELSRKLRKLGAASTLTNEQSFLHARASALLGRARELPAGSHEFDRVRRAVEDLLDAGGEIWESQQPSSPSEGDDQEETARKLERTYFRIQQADYFARLTGEKDAGEYVQHSRRLYQQARRAYDTKDWRKARKLAEAASEIVDALEHLAQARVRIPEPPRIE